MSRNVVKRHQFADYLNVGDEQTPEFVLMGVGFTTLDEEPGAQTETKKYVNEKNNCNKHSTDVCDEKEKAGRQPEGQILGVSTAWSCG